MAVMHAGIDEFLDGDEGHVVVFYGVAEKGGDSRGQDQTVKGRLPRYPPPGKILQSPGSWGVLPGEGPQRVQ